MGQTRVVIADAHPLFRDGLAREIRQDRDLRVVADLANGHDALEAIRRLRPDVAVVDVDLPGLDGPRIARAVAQEGLPTRVLLVAAVLRRQAAVDAVAAGARGYLSKRQPGRAVVDAIRRVAAGEAALCPDMQTVVLGELRLLSEGGELLSRREHETLVLLAKGLTTPEIGRRLHLAPSTVKSYTSRIYERLGVSNRAQAVAEGMRRGLLQ